MRTERHLRTLAMPSLFDAWYLNAYSFFLLCTVFGLLVPIFLPLSKSAPFLLVLFTLASLGFQRAVNKKLPPLLSGLFAMSQGRFDWSLLPFFVVYLTQAFVLGTANNIPLRKLHLWTSTLSVALLICVPFGIGSLILHGAFSPFTLFDPSDGTFSKNVYGILLFTSMIFWIFWSRSAGKSAYPLVSILLLLLCFATESRGLLLALIYFFGTVVFSMSFRVLAGPMLVILTIITIQSVDWDSTSENRIVRLGDTITQVATQQIYDDGNNDLYRLTIMVSAYQAWNQNKLFGLGPGHDKIGVANNVELVSFASERIIGKVDENVWGTHNFYLKILVEYGAMSLFILIFFWRLARRLRKISKALFHGFIGVLIFSATNNVPTGIVYFPVLFLFQAVSLCPSIRNHASEMSRPSPSQNLAIPLQLTDSTN